MGHLAWLAAYQEGEEGIIDFLSPFLKGSPPFVLSDAFPATLLPKPLGQKKGHEVKDLDSYANEKTRRKAEFLGFSDFETIRRGGRAEVESISSPWIGIEVLRAAINRATGTTGEGGNLFMTESWSLKQGMWENNRALLSIYVYCLDGWIERIEKMFSELSLIGFGKDKSVGLGHFEYLGKEKWDGFAMFEGANGFISLSTFVPGVNDPTEGRWAINIKYGKLGENAGGGNPFKKPLLQIRPGSIFFTGNKPKPYYGRVVEGIAPGFPEAVQICYCLAVPCCLGLFN
jgi:CRISPR-associated protein Csm4